MDNFMELLLHSLRAFGITILQFVPNLLAMLIIFIAGYLFSRLIKLLFLRVSEKVIYGQNLQMYSGV